MYDLDCLLGDTVVGSVVVHYSVASVMCKRGTFWFAFGNYSGGHLSIISCSIQLVDLILC